MKLELGEHPQGTVLAVRALPGARRSGVRGVYAGALKVAVAQPAEKGRANEALLDLLAELLGVARGQLKLLSGATAPQKRVLICGIERAQLVARLGKALAETRPQ